MRSATRLCALWVSCFLTIGAASIEARAQPSGSPSDKPSGASEPTKDAIEEANKLFASGTAAYDEGAYGRALSLFRESYLLNPKPKTLYNIGLAEEQRGMIASAIGHFHELLGILEEKDPRIPDVKARIEKLRKRAPQLTVRLASGAPEGTVVEVAGVAMSSEQLASPLLVDPGSYEIVVTSPGRWVQTYNVVVVVGGRVTQEVAASPEALSFTNQPGFRGIIAIPSLVAMIGGLGAGVGLTVGSVLRGKSGDTIKDDLIAKTLPEHSICLGNSPSVNSDACADLKSAYDTQATLLNAAIVSYVVGGVGLAGVITAAARPSAKPGASGASAFAIAPILSPSEFGLVVRLTH